MRHSKSGEHLHDLVIQRVFGASIALQGIASLIQLPASAARVRAVIRDLDTTIKELRTTIFGLHDKPQRAASLRAQLLDLATAAQDAHGRSPTVEFQGPIEAAVPDHLAPHLLRQHGEDLPEILTWQWPGTKDSDVDSGEGPRQDGTSRSGRGLPAEVF